ncbi:hypothetical protein OJ997_23810 [Solirubrobacter phytolaccae]|uniref:Ankyrin repeat domain-containing protein n=1 Tax=Solirubrobacter phytolaccae TaxID=1404360 RepID=A0A9X3NKY4_9ACTN|nr:hypothetical protein [Solirubrobacter phytolaccae]MDA0183357.1 hypothetical protein [Solirubrobacter phytolaccae]
MLGIVEEVLRAATSGRRARAEALLAEHPEVAQDRWVRLTAGRAWDGDVNAPGGPLDRAPLLYACFSVFDTTALARDLLARGADPNATFLNEYGQMPALYGAAGVRHDPELTRALLEAGANPNDGESAYHATEAPDAACLKLVLEFGAVPEPIVLAHALDHDRIEHAQVLLAAGADPRELLPFAVRRGRGPETLRLLHAHGADLEHRGGETWRGDVPLRTAYQHAVLRGQSDNARTLAELGANTEVDAADRAVAELRDDLPRALDVDQQEVVILAALRGRMARVVELLGPDFRGVVGGSPEGALLEHVSWVGDPALAHFLLEHGARPVDLGWAAHGSQHHALDGRDYVGVAEALVGAGATVDRAHLEQADGALAEWLAARLPR